MYVIATAGHVDHGKSTLVRALTGIDPDRLEEEKRRGLTIDLGFAWTTLPSGEDLAFVDVPGHERFLGNMLAGVGPAPMALLVVAADEGWQAQTSDHVAAIDALGLAGVVALTRADKPWAEGVEDDVRRRLVGTSLENAPVVPVAAPTGQGLDELREVLDRVVASAPRPDPAARVRLWIDRAFSVTGAGTVVTGTLTAGTLRVGDKLTLGDETVEVRGLQSENVAREEIGPVSRVAVNLRGVEVGQVSRGDCLLTPHAWPQVSAVDARVPVETPDSTVAHIGTASIPVRIRRLGGEFARLHFARRVALAVGERLVLRGTGSRHVLGCAQVVDLDPVELRRRGDAARRAQELAEGRLRHIERRGALNASAAALLGIDKPDGAVEFAGWWVHPPALVTWKEQLLAAVDSLGPLEAGLPRAAAAAQLPAPELLPVVVAAAQLEDSNGVISRPGPRADLGPAEDAVASLEAGWRQAPFRAPEAGELERLGLGTKELAAAQRAGRLLRIGGVVLPPQAEDLARARLREIAHPFSLSAARQALGTTRRVAVPLLEHLDARGVTRRVDGNLRRLL
ncbi:translation elongation factor [Corynebacterium phocae]|uniref:Translation elongation factor n=1 Tax=Corynebacterium phocae TaxID=161895 RepID=A0A1L7D4H1_9CORY|nr:selenocysteine-specific translation elongation factor [Corynebacterium phocae]APT92832.1 translation elongation factor [Corynebacterium phocae]KAA8723148.1 selenocysteine-specific translation elongation factor [Corynebacterium phocae]